MPAQARARLQEPFVGAQPLRQALAVVEPIDADDQRAADQALDQAQLGQGRNERSVFGRQHRQIRRTVGRLRRLVVAFDGCRREMVQAFPVLVQPLAEADGVCFRTSLRAQSRFENHLRQADIGRNTEAVVDRSPFPEECPVATDVWQQRIAASRVVNDRARGALEELRNLVTTLADLARQELTIKDVRERWVLPCCVPRPLALGWKQREQTSIGRTPEGDRLIGQREDVLPERVTRPIFLHRGEVVAPACRSHVGGGGRLRIDACHIWRSIASSDDLRRRGRNRRGHRDGECQNRSGFHRAHSTCTPEALWRRRIGSSRLQARRLCSEVRFRGLWRRL